MHNTSLVDSRVTVDGMEANNGTMVRCVALPVNVSLPAVLILAQERVQIYFHGKGTVAFSVAVDPTSLRLREGKYKN